MAQSHNCAGLGDGDRCHMSEYCQYKLVAANAPGSGERFCGKDQLTGHCCDAQKEPPKDEPEPIPCSNCKGTGVEHSIWSVGNSSGMSSGTCRVCKGTGQKPIPKEPELVICPKAQDCDIKGCMGQNPHEHTAFCDCKDPCSGCPSCAPYKKGPAQTKEHDDACDALRYVWVKHDLKKDGGVDLSALEKDIGDLTLRMDLVDSRQAHDFRMITHLNKVLSIVGEFGSDRLYKIEERIGALEKKVK